MILPTSSATVRPGRLGRMIAWRMQEQAFGGLDRESLMFLEGLARHGGSPRRQLKPGTVLVRDYQGQRHVLGAKRLELLRQLVPMATTIAVLVGLESPETAAERRDLQVAAQAVGQQLVVFDAASERDIETAFAMFVQRGARAVITVGGAFIFSNRERIVALAARHALPASYANRELVEAGGLTPMVSCWIPTRPNLSARSRRSWLAVQGRPAMGTRRAQAC